MSSTRVYVGRISTHASERDLECFFRGYGRIRDIVLKRGFGFIEFEDTRNAEDAVYELNGKYLCGNRVIVEFSRPRGSTRAGYGGRNYDRYGGRHGGDRFGGGSQRTDRYGPPTQIGHRLIVDNLSSRISWQDLKDTLREAGCAVTYADAHKIQIIQPVVSFASRSDLLLAKEKFDEKEVDGHRLKLTDVSTGSRSRSRSRSWRRSRSRSGSRSRSSSARHSSSRGGFKMQNDPVMKAVGFGMPKLKSFPSSRLPGDIQIEVIEEMDMARKIQLFNVNSGFRGYFARNGFFGGHVDEIRIHPWFHYVRDDEGEIHIQRGANISIEKGPDGNDFETVDFGDFCRRFDDVRNEFAFHQDRALFRYISSCARFVFGDDCATDDEIYCSGSIDEKGKETLIKENADLKNMGKWFPNLRLVKTLGFDRWDRKQINQEILESFRFKVTEFANFPGLHLSDWEHLIDQLSICQFIFIKYGWSKEFPGMEVENDPKKKDDILEAFRKSNPSYFSDHHWNSVTNFPGISYRNCYRRKIAEDKETFMIVGQIYSR